MVNIGFVLYTPGDEPGTLYAKWCHPFFGDGVFGTGKASGGPAQGYEGSYNILYYDPAGNEVGSFELQIIKHGDYYELAWVDNGEITDRGIGMEINEGLAAGWRRISDTPPQGFETQE